MEKNMNKIELPKDASDIKLPDSIIKQMNDNASIEKPYEYKGLRLMKDRVLVRVIMEISLFELINSLEKFTSNYSRVQIVAYNSERLSEIKTKPGDYARLTDPASMNNPNDPSVRFIYKKDNEPNTMQYIKSFLESLPKEEQEKYISNNNQRAIICRYYIVDAFNITSAIDRNEIDNWFSYLKPNE